MIGYENMRIYLRTWEFYYSFGSEVLAKCTPGMASEDMYLSTYLWVARPGVHLCKISEPKLYYDCSYP
jgi:beta-galactosidase/beta-glucuronidase